MALPKVVPISELRADAAGLVKCARESREPVIITQRGRATAVLMSIEDYNREIDQARMIQSIMRGMADIREGRTVSAEEVASKIESKLRAAGV